MNQPGYAQCKHGKSYKIGCSIRVMPYVCEPFLAGFGNFPDDECMALIPDFYKCADNDTGSRRMTQWIKDNWRREYWAVDRILGDKTIGGSVGNLVMLMKYKRILGYTQLVKDNIVDSPEDLMDLVRRIDPDVDAHILAFDKEERFWERMQEEGHEENMCCMAEDAANKLIERLRKEVEEEYK